MKEQKSIAITHSEFAMLKEDLRFLKNAPKTVQVQLLKERDEADGKYRLREPTQN